VPDKVTPLKVATPAEAVPVTVPPNAPPVPLAMATVTTVLLSVVTRLPSASRICTTGWVAKAAPLAPPTGCVVMANCVAAPAVPVAVKVSGEPLKLPLVAVSVFAPAVVPRVQAGLVAMPALSVVTAPVEANEPPPVATAKVTDTPLTALPCASVTLTDGAVATAVATVALWLFPPVTAIVVAALELTVTLAESAAVNVGLEVNLST
jgi:hypothetical protein